MGFKNFYLAESKTYKDSNQFVTIYHASPEGDIKRFRPKMKKILGDEVVFFSPSFTSLVLDWIPYVRGKKQGDELYKTIYLYTVKIPKTTYKKAKEYFYGKIKESGDNFGFWSWGEQIFLTKDMVNDIEIVNVKKLSKGEVKKLYSQQYNNTANRSPNVDKISYEYLKNLPKDEINKLHLKIHETMLNWKKQNKDISELEKLNKELNNLRLQRTKDFMDIEFISSKKIDKKKIKEIEIKFENIINPKTPSRDKTKEFQEWSGKIIEKLKNLSSQAVQKIIIPRLAEFRDLNKKDEFKKALNSYKEWLGDDL
jgi:hypothetical protein